MGLLGKLTGADKAKKQAKDARKMAARREAGALGELTPEAMQAMMQKLFTQYMSLLGPSAQFSQQALGASASRSGTLGGGVNRALSAGIPGQMAQGALGKAMGGAMDIGQQRAGIRMEHPIITNPARSGLTDLVDLALQYYSGGQMGTGSMQQGPRQF